MRRLTWSQVYRDAGLKWEKIVSIKPPSGIAALYSLRITRSHRATAYREGDFIRLLTLLWITIAPMASNRPAVPALPGPLLTARYKAD